MKLVFSVALGILAAIGGYVDIGDIVFNTTAGATFGYQLLWAIVLGVGGIMVYAEMCGRVAAISERAVFDVVRERLGFSFGLVTLVGAVLTSLLTLAAEIGGIALALELLGGLSYHLLIVLAVVGLAVVLWRRCRSAGSSASSATAGSRCSWSSWPRSSSGPTGAPSRTASSRTPTRAT